MFFIILNPIFKGQTMQSIPSDEVFKMLFTYMPPSGVIFLIIICILRNWGVTPISIREFMNSMAQREFDRIEKDLIPDIESAPIGKIIKSRRESLMIQRYTGIRHVEYQSVIVGILNQNPTVYVPKFFKKVERWMVKQDGTITIVKSATYLFEFYAWRCLS